MATHCSNNYRLLPPALWKSFVLAVVLVPVALWFLTASVQEAWGAKTPVDLSSAIEQVAEQTIPAVVHIEVTQRQEAKLTVLCKGKKEELAVKIGNLEDATKLLSASVKERLGAEVRSVMAKEKEKYVLDSQHGVVVAWLDKQGPLGQVGFEVGDIILEINGQRVEGMESFIDLVNTLKPRQKIAVLALDHRSGDIGYVQVVVQ
jgi:membrane-associated protease RseP (regulator of RpoE activity)